MERAQRDLLLELVMESMPVFPTDSSAKSLWFTLVILVHVWMIVSS